MRRFMWVFLLACNALCLLNANMLSLILENKQLRVCIWPEYYGISYLDPRTQTLLGVDIELAKEFGRDLGVNVHFVESSFATLITDIDEHTCDIAMFAIARTPERAQRLTLTTPHLESDIYAITTQTNPRIQTWGDIDQEGVIVAVAKGTYHVNVMQQYLTKAKLLIVDSMHAREQEVEAGRADVFMTDYPFAMRMLAQREWAKLIRPKKTFHLMAYGWALPQHEPQWHQRVEAFIQTIKKDGRLRLAAQKHHLDAILIKEE